MINSINMNSYLETDPLQGIGNIANMSKYHRIDSEVFAEPLANIFKGTEGECDKAEEKCLQEVSVIDNVVIQKSSNRKYKKYYINIEDPLSLVCPQSNCDRIFSTIKLLKAHVRKVHCSDKKYICDVCGCMFICQYLLVRHSVVHSDQKIYCDICNLGLSPRTSLSAHMRTHSGMKPHICSICNKSFARASTLKTHTKFVHRVDKLQCHNCNERFDTRAQLTRHMSIHRQRKQDNPPT